MNKKDLIPIVLLFALFLAYPKIDEKFVSKIFPPKAKPVPAVVETAQAPSLPADTSLAAAPESAAQPAEAAAPATEATPAAEAAAQPEAEKSPEVLTTLANDRVELTFSSHGAGVVQAAILEYPSEKGSDVPVTFDFSGRPAAAPVGYPGLGDRADFEVAGSAADSVSYRKALPGGLVLTRTLTLAPAIRSASRTASKTPLPPPSF